MKQQWNRRRASAARRVPLAASLISQSSERLSPHRKSGADRVQDLPSGWAPPLSLILPEMPACL